MDDVMRFQCSNPIIAKNIVYFIELQALESKQRMLPTEVMDIYNDFAVYENYTDFIHDINLMEWKLLERKALKQHDLYDYGAHSRIDLEDPDFQKE
jgi:hypothetical protein